MAGKLLNTAYLSFASLRIHCLITRIGWNRGQNRQSFAPLRMFLTLIKSSLRSGLFSHELHEFTRIKKEERPILLKPTLTRKRELFLRFAKNWRPVIGVCFARFEVDKLPIGTTFYKKKFVEISVIRGYSSCS